MELFGTTGQERRAWLDRKAGDAFNALSYYLGPTGIPERLGAGANLLAYTDAGDMVEAGEASQALWNDPSLQNAARYATAGAALSLPFIGARGVNELSNNAIDWMADESGAFAGLGALTADRAAFGRAQDLAAAGASREEIWRDTGWFQGVDGQWRFEIDDSPSRVNLVTEVNGIPAMSGFAQGRVVELNPHMAAALGLAHSEVPDVFTHPDLYAAYPDLGNVWFNNLRAGGGNQAYYRAGGVGGAGEIGGNIGSSVDDLRSTSLHELQHAIQQRENFARGSNLDAAAAESGVKSAPDALAEYRKVAGEVEARNVQARRNMTAEQRRVTPPWATQDTPDEQQTIRGILERYGLRL